MRTTQEQIELSNGSFHGIPVEKIEKARMEAGIELQKAEEILANIKNCNVLYEEYGITVYDLGDGRYAHVDNTRINSSSDKKLQNIILSTSMHSQQKGENINPIKYEIALEDEKIKTVRYSFAQVNPLKGRNNNILEFAYNPNGPAVINFQDSSIPENVYYMQLCSLNNIINPKTPPIIGSIPGTKIVYSLENKGINQAESDLTSGYHFDKDGNPRDVEIGNLDVPSDFMLERPYESEELAPLNEKIQNSQAFFADKFSKLCGKGGKPLTPEEEIADLRNRMELMAKKHEAKMADLTNKLETEKEEKSRLNEELSRAQQINTSLSTSSKKTAAELEEQKAQNNWLTNQNKTLEKENNDLKGNIGKIAGTTAQIIKISKDSVSFISQSKLGNKISEAIEELPYDLRTEIVKGMEKIGSKTKKGPEHV